MFVLNEVQQLAWICLAHKLERTHLKGCCQLGDNLLCLVRAKRLVEQFLRITDTALRNILLSQTDLIERVSDILLDRR